NSNLLVGGDGNDTFVVSDSLDIVLESSTVNQGTDTVLVSGLASYALSDTIAVIGSTRFVENITLTTTAAAQLTGNSL
ncbi:hypothetical protein MEO41_29350, partial [Dolichospermum sp. ST_sed4]|nr:hypothetical protein [Dolichospermum sp. ST_sed4]